jgi:hypothetical protein
LKPALELDSLDLSMFDYQKSAFIIAAGLGSWDFKFSLFVLAPIYCFGYYFMLLVTNKSTNEYAP